MYVEHFELLDYFIANGIEDTRKKRVVLLTLSGASTYKLIRNRSAPTKPAEKSFDDFGRGKPPPPAKAAVDRKWTTTSELTE